MPIVNLLAVLIAAVAGMAIGALWYSPAILGRPWMRAMGIDGSKMQEMKKDGLGKTYFANFVGELVTAYVLASFIALSPSSIYAIAFWAWLGFMVPIIMDSVLWEKRSWNLFFINAGHNLVVILLMAFVISLFK